MTRRIRPLAAALVLALSNAGLASALVPPAAAQSYARFAVPDSARVRALAAARGDYEAAWNALLVAGIRARLAHADSAARLERLARDVAEAEPKALGSRIGLDALTLAKRWNRDRLGVRVDAAVAESLALVARNGRAFDRADSLLRGALAAYRTLGERRREAWVLGSRGANLLVAGRNAEAAAAYEPALAARRALGDSVLVGNTLNDLGQTYWQLSRFPEALESLREACAMREAQGRMVPLGGSLNYLGLTLESMGRPDSAIACLRRSLELTSAGGDSARTLGVLTNFLSVLSDEGRTDETLRVSERALTIARALGAADQAAKLEQSLGNLNRNAGRYGRALDWFDRSIEDYESYGAEAHWLALALSGKGLTQIFMGDPESARPVLDRALGIVDSIANPGMQAQVLSVLALAAERIGDPLRAGRLAHQAYDAANSAGDSTGIHSAAVLLAYLEREHGSMPAAEAWSRRAILAGARMRPEVRANDLHALGAALQLQGRLDEAEASQLEALELARAHGAHNEAMAALCNLGDVYERRGDDAAALEWYMRAAGMADTIRTLQSAEQQSISVFANRLYTFEAVIRLLARLERSHPGHGYGEQAFDWAERSRARAFIDLVHASGGQAARAPLSSLRDAQRLLKSDSQALFEYSVGDSGSVLWVVRRDGWHLFTLPSSAALRARVQALRHGLADPELAVAPPTARASRALYQMLIAPAESLLAGVDELIVAPDGVLALIPFEALLTRDAATDGRFPRGSYLVERYTVSYTPSASVLATRTAVTSDSLIVAVGAPEFGPEPVRSPGAVRGGLAPLASLPSTAVELAALRSLAPGRRVVELTGAAASRSRVLALPELKRAGLLHFATHGDVDEAEPEHSGLWLAPDGPGQPPSRIEVADIMDLRLSAGLVTLSACQTGLGRLESGEGVVGVMRAFLAAGAQSVLVSLWPVNDRSTAELMTGFYRRSLAGHARRGVALAAAKRALLSAPATRAPFYWAPFILVGQEGSP